MGPLTAARRRRPNRALAAAADGSNMCAICVDYQKGLLTLKEAKRNLDETKDSEHKEDVQELLADEEKYLELTKGIP